MEQGNIPSDFVAGGGSFANPGGTPDPYSVTGVGGTIAGATSASSNGMVLLEHSPNGTRAFSTVTACAVTQVLARNVLGGTGKRVKLCRRVAAGKTGTTQNNTDAWFVTFSPCANPGRSSRRVQGEGPLGNGGFGSVARTGRTGTAGNGPGTVARTTTTGVQAPTSGPTTPTTKPVTPTATRPPKDKPPTGQ